MTEGYSFIGRGGLKLLGGRVANEPVRELLCFGMEGAVRSEDKGNNARHRDGGVGVLICSDLVIIRSIQVAKENI